MAPQLIRLFGHSTLFYWWPVWFFGFVLCVVSLFDNTRAIQIPGKTTIRLNESDKTYTLSDKDQPDVLRRYLSRYAEEPDQRRPPRISHRAWMGASFLIVLLLVIGITNVPLRGLWSVVVIALGLILALGLALFPGAWEDIIGAIGDLHIFIGMAGYLFFSTVLFLMWLVSMFIFDHQTYIIFEPGQMKVCEEVGGGEKAYDTQGMSLEKQRSDLFRHWVLGLGSGDLTVRTSGATPHQITLNNVLFISRKLHRIEAMQREKQVVE
jgi:hypothetical protein